MFSKTFSQITRSLRGKLGNHYHLILKKNIVIFFFHLPPYVVLKKFLNLDSNLVQNKFSRYFTHSDTDKKEKKLPAAPAGGADVGGKRVRMRARIFPLMQRLFKQK